MFDEEPDGDPHGECAAEIHRLTALCNVLLRALQPFADADLTRADVRDTFGFDVLRARDAIDAARAAP